MVMYILLILTVLLLLACICYLVLRLKRLEQEQDVLVDLLDIKEEELAKNKRWNRLLKGDQARLKTELRYAYISLEAVLTHDARPDRTFVTIFDEPTEGNNVREEDPVQGFQGESAQPDRAVPAH